MEGGNWKNRIKEHGLVLLLFVVLTLILTYPVVAELTTQAVGPGGDPFLFKWNIWHVSETLRGGGGISDLYHSNLLYYPEGANLAFQALSLTNSLFLAFPLTLLIDNIVLIYNLLFLFNFIMAGYAMYLLVKYLIKDKAIAFLVGFAYTFSPLHLIWGASFLNLMSFLWTPLFLLFFFKMLEEEKLINAIIAAVFLFFLVLACGYHLIFAFLITASYFIYRVFTTPALFNKYFFLRVAIFLFLFGIAISPFVFPMISAYFGGEYSWPHDMFTEITLLHYLLPNPLQSLWGEGVQNLGGSELFVFLAASTVAPGYLVIFISLLYLIKTRKHLFWIFLAIFFALVSIDFQGQVILFLEKIPFVNATTQVHFFAFGALFSILLFFSFALGYFLPKQKHPRLLIFLAFTILVLEYISVPYYTTSSPGHGWEIIKSAEEISQAIKKPHPLLGDNFSVLAFPPTLDISRAVPNFYFQIFHEKPILEGEIGRQRIDASDRSAEIEKLFRTNEANKFRQLLEEYRVGYIIGYDGRMLERYSNFSSPRDLQIIEEQALLLLEQIPGEFVFMRPEAFYVYEVWSER